MAWDALGLVLVTNTSEMRPGRPTTAVVAVSSSRVLGTWARHLGSGGRTGETTRDAARPTEELPVVATPARWVSLDLRGRRNGAWAVVEA